MRPSLLVRATHYKPSIKFLGPRRNIEHAPHAPAPHPCAPTEIVDHFQSFLAKLQSSSAGPGNTSSNPKGQSPSGSAQGESASASASGGKAKPVDYENFWEAPSYLWTPKEVSEREIESVMSGGASDIRQGP